MVISRPSIYVRVHVCNLKKLCVHQNVMLVVCVWPSVQVDSEKTKVANMVISTCSPSINNIYFKNFMCPSKCTVYLLILVVCVWPYMYLLVWVWCGVMSWHMQPKPDLN